MYFEIFVNTGPYHQVLEISKCYFCNFHLISPEIYEDIGRHCIIQAFTFVGN